MEDGHRLTTDILQEAVAAELGLTSAAEVKVKSFEVTRGSNKGDNFACDMKAVELVVEVAGTERKMYYMAKCVPLNEDRATKMKETKIFDVEVAMYTKIIPSLKTFVKGISTPSTFYASSEKGILVMEDLKKKGYSMIDRVQAMKGLNLTQIKLGLQQLAFLHASSYHYMETYPNGGIQKFKEDYPGICTDSWLSPESKHLETEFEGMLSKVDGAFAAIIEEHCPDKPNLIQKLKKFAEVREAKLKAVHFPQGGFNCILHNDAWFNNFMFGKDDTAIKMVDLQLSRRARPTIDLVIFIAAGMRPNFRKEHLEDLLHYYHEELVRSLLNLGHDPSVYPFEQLRKDYFDSFAFGFCMSQMGAMIQITPDNKTSFMDPDKASEEKSMVETVQEAMMAQLEQTRQNATLRNMLIAVALEAEEMGVI